MVVSFKVEFHVQMKSNKRQYLVEIRIMRESGGFCSTEVLKEPRMKMTNASIRMGLWG